MTIDEQVRAIVRQMKTTTDLTDLETRLTTVQREMVAQEKAIEHLASRIDTITAHLYRLFDRLEMKP